MLAERLFEKTTDTTKPLYAKVKKRPRAKKERGAMTPHARLVKEALNLFPDSEILGHFPA